MLEEHFWPSEHNEGNTKLERRFNNTFFFNICPSPGLLPVLGPLERYMTPTLDATLLISSWAGADLGRTLD